MKIEVVNGDRTYYADVPDGWKVVTDGFVSVGDKLFDPIDNIWLTVIASDSFWDKTPVKDKILVIRQNRLSAEEELAKLKEAIRASGYGVLKESNGKWSIHDVSDKHKRELDREVRMIGEHISMLHALKAIVAHDPATCNGIMPNDCLEVVQEIARAAIKEVEDVK